MLYLPTHNTQLLQSMSIESSISHDDLAERTEGYSGADISLLCREAAMGPMRRVLATTSIKDIQLKRDEGSLTVPEVVMMLMMLMMLLLLMMMMM